MFLERRTVSRKTAGDGRLEITKHSASRVETLGRSFTIDLDGETVSASLGTMACTCRGAETPHVHYFLEAEALKLLASGGLVELELDEAAQQVRIRQAT